MCTKKRMGEAGVLNTCAWSRHSPAEAAIIVAAAARSSGWSFHVYAVEPAKWAAAA